MRTVRIETVRASSGQTDVCKHITFPRLRLRMVIIATMNNFT